MAFCTLDMIVAILISESSKPESILTSAPLSLASSSNSVRLWRSKQVPQNMCVHLIRIRSSVGSPHFMQTVRSSKSDDINL